MTVHPRARPFLVALEGPSGVGKSTLARAIRRRLSWPTLPEAYERLRPRPSLRFTGRQELLRLERTLLREECRRFRESTRSSELPPALVLDTGFLGPLTYVWGLRELGGYPDVVEPTRCVALTASRRGRWGLPDLTVYLHLPPDVLRVRLAKALSTHPPAYVVRHRRVGRIEGELWRRRVGPLLGRRFIRVSARGPEGVLVRRVERLVHQRLPMGPIDPALGERVLEALSRRGLRRARPRVRQSLRTARSLASPPR